MDDITAGVVRALDEVPSGPERVKRLDEYIAWLEGQPTLANHPAHAALKEMRAAEGGSA